MLGPGDTSGRELWIHFTSTFWLRSAPMSFNGLSFKLCKPLRALTYFVKTDRKHSKVDVAVELQYQESLVVVDTDELNDSVVIG